MGASYDQKPYRRILMETWGGEVVPSPIADPSSPGSLGLAISDAVADAAQRDDTHYALGSVLNHVLLHQTVIGIEAIEQMAQAGVGYYVDSLKLKAPKVVTVAIESAGGKEYHDYVAETVAKFGGTAHHVTMKVTAVDVTPQVLEIMNLKPDFITIYGVPNTAVLTMKALQQYGVSIPAFGIKIDAIPGRVNETWFKAEREGMYYGQCSRLCGANHAYMPIAVRIVSAEKYAAWLTEAKKKFASNDAKPVALAANE